MRMGQGVRTGLGHGGITCVLQTQFSSFFFSSPEPQAHGELLPSANVRRQSSGVRRQQLLQTTSPLKPLSLGP